MRGKEQSIYIRETLRIRKEAGKELKSGVGEKGRGGGKETFASPHWGAKTLGSVKVQSGL